MHIMNTQTRHFHTTKISRSTFYYTTLKIVLLPSILKYSTQPKICPATVYSSMELEEMFGQVKSATN